ncbi:hypothetical protein GGR58DRAFT_487608 [Xylaria digitata]|nr:hypothetical protein GGR58DRAFT_487608 [Xylaria digitata]
MASSTYILCSIALLLRPGPRTRTYTNRQPALFGTLCDASRSTTPSLADWEADSHGGQNTAECPWEELKERGTARNTIHTIT